MEPPITKAMIFAAGLGTRLRPLTDTRPKALVEIGGEPLLKIVIDKLAAAGVGRMVVNVCHFAGMIRDYLAENGNFGLDIDLSDETLFRRETGGGVLQARSLLEKDGQGPFLVHNVDILSNLDLGAFVAAAPSDAVSTIVVSDRPTSRYFLFDPGSMRLVGWTNVSTGEVRSPYPGLDPSRCRRLAFSGIHLMSGEIFDAFGDFGIGEVFSITDFYIAACRDLPIYGHAPEGLRIFDVGKISSLGEAEAFRESLLI